MGSRLEVAVVPYPPRALSSSTVQGAFVCLFITAGGLSGAPGTPAMTLRTQM